MNGTSRFPIVRFYAAWAVAWAAMGGIVALVIAFTTGRPFLPVLQLSILFAMVVGFTALTSARLVFPRFERLPSAVSLTLQVLTLFSGTVFGSVAALFSQPLFSLANPRPLVLIVLINAPLAVIVGFCIHTYDRMRRQIAESYETLRRKEALEREIEIARDVQNLLLPRVIPEVLGLELAAVCRPAVGVGGDFYDFLTHADDRLGIVVADVCGKGIPAALLMAGLQASVRGIAHPGSPPAEVNRRLNESVHRTTSDSRYATLFLALWDGQRRTIEYSNAGHYPPLLLRGEETSRLTANGLPIGVFAGSKYGQGRCELASGDLLVMYTDGIVEAPGPNDEEFGEARLARFVRERRRQPLDELLQATLAEVVRWSAGNAPHDDVTLVLARVR